MILPLNSIIKTEDGWCCNVFEFDKINTGNILVSWSDFDQSKINLEDLNFRIYYKTKKIIISSEGENLFNFCALKFSYSLWKCIFCGKISNILEKNCFCKIQSGCWTPINPGIIGVLYSELCNFNYHFDNNALDTIII